MSPCHHLGVRLSLGHLDDGARPRPQALSVYCAPSLPCQTFKAARASTKPAMPSNLDAHIVRPPRSPAHRRAMRSSRARTGADNLTHLSSRSAAMSSRSPSWHSSRSSNGSSAQSSSRRVRTRPPPLSGPHSRDTRTPEGLQPLVQAMQDRWGLTRSRAAQTTRTTTTRATRSGASSAST